MVMSNIHVVTAVVLVSLASMIVLIFG